MTITEVGKLLELPNLEQDTIKAINERIRSMLAALPKDAQSGSVPVATLQQKASEMLGSETVNEWLHGPPPKEGDKS